MFKVGQKYKYIENTSFQIDDPHETWTRGKIYKVVGLRNGNAYRPFMSSNRHNNADEGNEWNFSFCPADIEKYWELVRDKKPKNLPDWW